MIVFPKWFWEWYCTIGYLAIGFLSMSTQNKSCVHIFSIEGPIYYNQVKNVTLFPLSVRDIDWNYINSSLRLCLWNSTISAFCGKCSDVQHSHLNNNKLRIWANISIQSEFLFVVSKTNSVCESEGIISSRWSGICNICHKIKFAKNWPPLSILGIYSIYFFLIL